MNTVLNRIFFFHFQNCIKKLLHIFFSETWCCEQPNLLGSRHKLELYIYWSDSEPPQTCIWQKWMDLIGVAMLTKHWKSRNQLSQMTGSDRVEALMATSCKNLGHASYLTRSSYLWYTLTRSNSMTWSIKRSRKKVNHSYAEYYNGVFYVEPWDW